VDSSDEHVLPASPLSRAELDYARGAVVGAVVVDRRTSSDGSAAVVITIHRSTPAFRASVVLAGIGAIVLSGAVAMRFLSARPSTIIESLWIVFALTGLAWMITGASRTFDALRPRTIEIANHTLSILVRREREMVRASVASGDIADVLLEPAPLRVAALSHGAQRATAVHVSGERIHLHEGTRAETAFVRQVLAAELALRDVQWVDATLLRPRWPSRLKARLDPFGFEVHQPAAATWTLLALTAIVSPTLPFLVAWVRVRMTDRSWQNIWEREPPVLWGVGALLLGLALSAIVYHFRRSVAVTLDSRVLTISESSPLRPALYEWPTLQLKSFMLREPARGGRCSIDVELADGSQESVLERLTIYDAKIAFELMTIGLTRAQSARG